MKKAFRLPGRLLLLRKRNLCPFWFFRSMFSEEERLRETVIEELDQRSHKEGGDQGTDARQQTGESTDDHTDQVAADSDKAEGPFPVLEITMGMAS